MVLGTVSVKIFVVKPTDIVQVIQFSFYAPGKKQ